MLSSCLKLPVSRHVQEIKGTSVLQMFFKYHVSFVDLYSCTVLAIFLDSSSALLWRQGVGRTYEMVHHFALLCQNSAASSPGLLGCQFGCQSIFLAIMLYY